MKKGFLWILFFLLVLPSVFAYSETLSCGSTRYIEKLQMFPSVISSSVFSFRVPDNYCFQESANTTNQVGTDGVCGLNYNGSYYFDYSNSSYPEVVGYMYVNYTKPLNSLDSSIWSVDLSGVQINLTNTNSNWSLCYSSNLLNLSLRYISLQSLFSYGSSQFDCWNGTNWLFLKKQVALTLGGYDSDVGYEYTLIDGNHSLGAAPRSSGWSWDDTVGVNYANLIFEEAMYWSISHNYSLNFSFINSSKYYGQISSSSYNYSSDFYGSINDVDSYVCSCQNCLLNGTVCLLPVTFGCSTGNNLSYVSNINVFSPSGSLDSFSTFVFPSISEVWGTVVAGGSITEVLKVYNPVYYEKVVFQFSRTFVSGKLNEFPPNVFLFLRYLLNYMLRSPATLVEGV